MLVRTLHTWVQRDVCPYEHKLLLFKLHLLYMGLSPGVLKVGFFSPFNTLATGYGDFRTSVAKRRRRATEISVFPYGWMEEGVGFVMC